MDKERPIDTFQETTILTVGIPKEVYKKKKEIKEKSFQTLLDKLSLDSNIQLFAITALIGKYIVKKREKTGPIEGFFRYKENEEKDEMYILKALAVHEVDNIYILKDQEAMCKIWEEYAYAGFLEIYEWYKDNNITLETKLVDSILKALEEKKKEENN